MVIIGEYQTEDGREYICLFHPDEQYAEAVGPFPKPLQEATRRTVLVKVAPNVEKAKLLLEKSLGPGHWVQ